MLDTGTRVKHRGHGEGTVVARNTTTAPTYNIEKGVEIVDGSMATYYLGYFYTGDKYPNIIQFDTGYCDVYADSEVDAL